MKPKTWLTESIYIYLAFWLAFALFAMFVGDFGAGKTVSAPPTSLPWSLAFGIDILLMALFGVQHSVMARPAFKRRMAHLVPEYAVRSVFILASIIVLMIVIFAWQPLDAPLWNIEWRPVRLALLATFILGGALIFWATVAIDHFHFFGIRQCLRAVLDQPQREPEFQVAALYGWVRHPIHLGMLMMLWSAPTMTAGRLLFASGMTVYILIGLSYEERDLHAQLGAAYKRYRARVPMLLPKTPGTANDPQDVPANGSFWGVDVPRLPGLSRLPKIRRRRRRAGRNVGNCAGSGSALRCRHQDAGNCPLGSGAETARATRFRYTFARRNHE